MARLEHGLGPGAGAPKAYVGGPAPHAGGGKWTGPRGHRGCARNRGIQVCQTISLSAGDAGKRLEFGNVVDWNTRRIESEGAFPLAASNQMATYNWDIGTIERPTAEPKKFEVPSHQWIDLTDMRGEFGATILTDCKNGSDKPNDHTIRLTLIRTPGTRGGYHDQGTQDLGHHEFVYGIAGHAGGWRNAGTDWQGQRLNAPLNRLSIREACGRAGPGVFFHRIGNSRIRLLALKKAEQGDESIARYGGTRWQAAAECADVVCRAHRCGSRSERPGAAGGPRHDFRRGTGNVVYCVSAANIRGQDWEHRQSESRASVLCRFR